MSEKQLIDATMYAPQWVDIVEKYLNWPGLKSACWYFHAHVNEAFSPVKESIVARFSPLTPEELRTGAFDINWFTEAYKALGEERFQVLYDSAKYIAAGALHKRAQLFADAVLGNKLLVRNGSSEEKSFKENCASEGVRQDMLIYALNQDK